MAEEGFQPQQQQQQGAMSLNVHLAVPVVTTADGSHTPNTPEILNSIVNMQNGPFAGYVPPPSALAAASAGAGANAPQTSPVMSHTVAVSIINASAKR